MKKSLLYIALLLITNAYSQNKIDLKAIFNIEANTVSIEQSIEYKNTTSIALDTIYLIDWNNSFSTKITPLAKRIAEEYSTSFHFAENEERGFTTLTRVSDEDHNDLYNERLLLHPDVIKVALKTPLSPNDSYKIALDYILKIPKDKFTAYGVTPLSELYLKYWYITPAIFDGEWHYFSNKNLDDLYVPKSDLIFQLDIPLNYVVTSELDLLDTIKHENSQTVYLAGEDRVDTRLFLHKSPSFKTVQTDDFTVVSNMIEKDLESTDKAIITDKITSFITNNLGTYPHEKLLVTTIDIDKDPIYGLNQLPDFIRPFPKNFQFELTLLKSTIANYLNNTLLINPRKDQWLKDGLQIYFLMKYIEENYPDMKLLGSLANVWGIRSFHAADLNFNEQYGLAYMHMARTNRDQPIGMAKDSLLKFNANLANKYKAGIGFKYLDDFINEDILETAIKAFFEESKLQSTNPKEFETFLNSKTSKDIDWFFKDYVYTNKRIDFSIKNLKQTEDSLSFTIVNKKNNDMPVSLFAFDNDSLVSKQWIENISGKKRISIPKNSISKLALNYDNVIPEYNQRDNWKSLKGLFSNGKPLQFRLVKDFEDPHYNQVFIMPMLEYKNIYDGLTLGTKFYNRTLLRKQFNYKLSTLYSTRSKSFTGSANLYYSHNIQNRSLYDIVYGISASYGSYAEDLFVRRITPSFTMSFRDKDDLRSNEKQILNLRYLDINRDEDINNISDADDPNYKVLNLRYLYSDDNLINFKKWFADFQIGKTFGKIAFNYEYRKLFESNRQLNIRIFAGTFIYNKNPTDFNYFSFALDRPTDYIFDYNYLGRSESSGIFSQQLIIAEGGFKSKLDPAFANQWITTANASTTLWKYIQAYGDVGLVKNKFNDAKFVYDSGIRLNLVTDYFEIYFPIYSNLGWEIAQPNYDQKIRFVFTADPATLLGLFRRKWY